MFYKVPVNDGMLDIDYEDLLEAVQLSPAEVYVRLGDAAAVRATWQEITEAEFGAVRPVIPETITPPDTTTLLGQYIAQQTLKNAEIEQKINAVGQGVVQLMLK